MNIADRIQYLRKSNGMSQEELADKIGVSRQAISKWESEQSLPDIKNIILISQLFEVTTDYLLIGVEDKPIASTKKIDARFLTAVATFLNFMGIIVAIASWFENQNGIAVVSGLILMATGCFFFGISQIIGKNTKSAFYYFGLINVWILSYLPITVIGNLIKSRMGGYSFVLTPLPEMGNSMALYLLFWLVYIVFCALISRLFVKKYKPIENLCI